MSGAQTQGGAPAAQGSQGLAPMQMLQSYKSAPDRAAWMQQNQAPAQQAQPWQPPQRMYSSPTQGMQQGTGMLRGMGTSLDAGQTFGLNGDRANNSMTYQVLNNQRQQGAK